LRGQGIAQGFPVVKSAAPRVSAGNPSLFTIG